MLGKVLVEPGFGIGMRRLNRSAGFAFYDFRQHVDDRGPILDDQSIGGGVSAETALRRQKGLEHGGQILGIGMFESDHADYHPITGKGLILPGVSEL